MEHTIHGDVSWSVQLQSKDHQHVSTGEGWPKLLAAVKTFKAKADDDAGDTVTATWMGISGVRHRWIWHSLNDVPAGLPEWEE